MKCVSSELLRACFHSSFQHSSESSEFWFLLLPRDNGRQCTCPLVVGLHQGEGVQDLLPLLQVVNVLEGGMVGVVEEVKDDHDGVVSEGCGGSCKPFPSTLIQQLLQRIQPLWQEVTKIFFHHGCSFLKRVFFTRLCGSPRKHHLGQLGPNVLVVACHHVCLRKLQVSLASKAGPSCHKPDNGHRLCQLHSIPTKHWYLTKSCSCLVLARPILKRDPVILKVKVARVQEKSGQPPLGFHVKVGELDHRHLDELCCRASEGCQVP